MSVHRVALLPFIVLLQNKPTKLAESGENLINAHASAQMRTEISFKAVTF